VVVERPMYVNENIPNAGGMTTGASSAIGATSLGGANGSDWLFAEGYTGPGFQEYLVLANFTPQATTATVKLEYTNGSVQTVAVPVNGQSQVYFDVNNAYAHPNCTSTNPCTPTTPVSAEVTAPTASIVAERVMFFHYAGAVSGETDVVGQAGPASKSTYSFAEGFTDSGFAEYLTLQNPTNTSEVVAITYFADNTIVEQELTLPAHSRSTVSVNSVVVPIATAYPNGGAAAYTVSMVVQALNGGTVVAERPLYFTFQGDPGGTDVMGYTGG
jgi:hypothetical protein